MNFNQMNFNLAPSFALNVKFIMFAQSEKKQTKSQGSIFSIRFIE